MSGKETSPLNDLQLDLLQELINIGVGRAGGLLNQMTSSHVSLNAPEIRVMGHDDLPRYKDRVTAIKLTFEGRFYGTAALVFPPESASKLVSVLIGEEDVSDMDSLRTGALQEVGNIVLNAVMGSLGNLLQEHINYLPPDYYEISFSELIRANGGEGKMVLFVRTTFSIEEHVISGDIIIIFNLGAFDCLLSAIDRMIESDV